MAKRSPGTEFVDGGTYMDLSDVSKILFDARVQKAFLKSGKPHDTLMYLNTVLKYHEVKINEMNYHSKN